MQPPVAVGAKSVSSDRCHPGGPRPTVFSVDPNGPSCARIVIADGHLAFVQACVRLLGADYGIVATVRSGGEALEAVKAHEPDALVLDLATPDLAALEVAAQLKAWGLETRVVVLALHHEPAIAAQAFAMGAAAYVAKARLVRDLVPAIESALSGARFCSPPPNGAPP